MKRYKHLFEQVCSFENLYAAAKKALKGKRGKRPGVSYERLTSAEVAAFLRFFRRSYSILIVF